MGYGHDARGKVTSITDHAVAGANRAFSYDANGRLITASGAWGSGSYKYDALANIRQRTMGARTVDIAYDAAKNRVSSVTDTANPYRVFTHDARGNVTNDGRYNFTYDMADQPTSVAGPGVSAAYTCMPFGEKLLDPAGNRDDTGFTGHIDDDLTGLTYMQARYYDPVIGRFYSTDPIDYQDQLNLYAYVANDPVNMFDPTGEYGRGTGWSDDDWAKFDSAQQAAAGRLEQGAADLNSAAAELKAGGELSAGAQTTIASFEAATGQTATAKNLSSTAKTFAKGAKALRDDGSKGYMANAISKPGDPTFASVNKVGGKLMTVNSGHEYFQRSDGTLGPRGAPAIGHESLHSAGKDDQRWSGNGMRAYRYGSKPGHREAIPPSQRINNPDHLMSMLYP